MTRPTSPTRPPAWTWTRRLATLSALVLAATLAPLSAARRTPDPAPLPARDSDPVKLGWMIGSPPPADRIIRFADGDYFNFPKSRWTVCHFRALMPTTGVSRGLGAPVPLARAIDAGIDGITFKPLGGGKRMTWAQSLEANYTDGIVVLHKGSVVYERYTGCIDETGQHGAMSVTKSLTGLLGEMLVAEGVIHEDDTVGALVPELSATAFGDATVRQILEMTTGLRYSEDYADPDAEVWTFSAAGSPLPKPADYQGPRSYWEYLQTVRKQGEHGQAFGYKTINTEVLGWILARKTGRSVAQLLSERIWSKLGAEQDAYFTVDSTGTPFAGGGLNAGLRDLARIGQLMLDGGTANGQRLIPEAAIRRIRAGGDRTAFSKGGYLQLKGWSYRGMWWITHNPHGAFTARGVHGQAIYVDPQAQMVIARFGSHPLASNGANDATSLPAYAALAEYLMKRAPTNR